MAEDSMEAFFAARGFGRTIGFGEKSALLVIDMVRAFTNPELPLGAPLDRQIEVIRELLAVAREREVPIFYTSVAYEDRDWADAGIWALKQAGIMTLRAGTPEVEVDERLGRRPEEPVIFKKYASAFFGTDLLTRLNTRRVDTLILTGCTTSGCVRATAVDGLQNGFRVMVVREAVGDRAAPAYEQSLFDLQAKYADVVSAQAVLAYWEKAGGPSVRD